jgi:hypothetical protein
LLSKNQSFEKTITYILLTVCFIVNVKPITSQTTLLPCNTFVSDANALAAALDNAQAGNVICIDADINLDLLTSPYSLPLTVKAGVILQGNPEWTSININPNLPGNAEPFMIFSNTHRFGWYNSEMFLFEMEPCNTPPCSSTVIRNLRLRGPSRVWHDFNIGYDPNNASTQYSLKLTVGGIKVKPFSTQTYGENCIIENCEISGFVYCAIETRENNKDITIRNCYIHHNKASTYHGQGYGVWLRSGKDAGNPTNLNVVNNVFDDCKDAIDGQTYQINGADVNGKAICLKTLLAASVFLIRRLKFITTPFETFIIKTETIMPLIMEQPFMPITVV